MMDKAFKVLKKYYGFHSFKEGQYKIVENILQGKDTFVIMPTGGGKSLCYQIPAVLFHGITLVISPLISLMKDQVDALKAMGISAAYINSTQTLEEINSILDDADIGVYKLIYIAPERLEFEAFCRALRRIHISQVAVDEAHCVSQWGHDFRPSYRNIAPFINSLKVRPVVTAFTATATQAVKEDTVKLLGLNGAYFYPISLNRENLMLNVIEIESKEHKVNFIVDYLKNNINNCGIIYVSTRKEADELYEYLIMNKFSVGKYHGGMEYRDKNRFQEDFIYDNFNVMIATNAFGMGIDKSNIRFIIHYNLPKNIESYYQEIGRGGRDGDFCQCYLLFHPSDIALQEFLIKGSTSENRLQIEISKLQAMQEYALYSGCYTNYILKYFGEPIIKDYCSTCSNCINNKELRDITLEAQMILSCIYRTKGKYGISVLIDILKGYTGPKIKEFNLNKLSTYGIMKEYNTKFIKDIINTLISQGYLDRRNGTYSMVKLNSKSFNILKGKEKLLTRIVAEESIMVNDVLLFDILRRVRREIAAKEKVPPYIIFSDSVLMEMCKELPENHDDFLNIKGVGEKKSRKYAQDFLKAIRLYKSSQIS